MFAIPKTMRAVVYRGVNQLQIETVPVPRIGPHELLVRVAACGVCPTDIKKIHYGTVPPPRIFGHETAGTIVRTGVRVRGFKPGDRVALHHHVPCLDCHACRHHAFAQCEQYKRTGITAGFEPAGGGFAEYVRVMPFVLPGVVKIPAKNTFEEGAMLEPVNTVLKAVKRLSLLPGDQVLVAGQGPIGLMFTRLLQLRGMKVLATDLMASRLQLARQFGAKWACHPDEIADPRSHQGNEAQTSQFAVATDVSRRTFPQLPASSQRRLTSAATVLRQPCVPVQGSAFPLSRFPLSALPLDAAILAVPSDAALTQALQMIRGAGQILLFAHTKRASTLNSQPSISGLFPLDLASVCVDEKDLIGSYSADFTLQREVARLVFSRQLDVRPLITHRYPLTETAAAVQLASHPTPDSLKILIQS